ncbi:MAG: hypothetical protein KJ893_08955 [Candidatus Omnitrophica bacterium]|nr:hypothetical protein [Candidatus Omnitrophota bacterium]MBU4477826.1 hypothetical protein [Candidatus Omnitrophota bacterium]MCG2703461.1 hypothetical protein [Candidatus Omnitrophota bacterium]
MISNFKGSEGDQELHVNSLKAKKSNKIALQILMNQDLATLYFEMRPADFSAFDESRITGFLDSLKPASIALSKLLSENPIHSAATQRSFQQPYLSSLIAQAISIWTKRKIEN